MQAICTSVYHLAHPSSHAAYRGVVLSDSQHTCTLVTFTVCNKFKQIFALKRTPNIIAHRSDYAVTPARAHWAAAPASQPATSKESECSVSVCVSDIDVPVMYNIWRSYMHLSNAGSDTFYGHHTDSKCIVHMCVTNLGTKAACNNIICCAGIFTRDESGGHIGATTSI